MGSDDDACDLTIAANIACDITHLGDLGKFFDPASLSALRNGIPAITSK